MIVYVLSHQLTHESCMSAHNVVNDYVTRLANEKDVLSWIFYPGRCPRHHIALNGIEWA